MADKPSYLGLLNAIAVGESRGYRLLSTWAERTDNEALARVLEGVAVREQEHAAAFAKRISELGFRVRAKDDPTFPQRLEAAASGRSDREKFKQVLDLEVGDRRGDGDGTDAFARLFDDTTIDVHTGALLGRFIAEERDSGRRLRAALEALPKDEVPTSSDVRELERIRARLDALTATIEELKAKAKGKASRG